MFPISDSARSNRIPFISLFLIAVNLLVFFQELQSPSLSVFISQYALIPSKISFSNLQSLTSFITSAFLHGGFFHLFSNMWFLWIFGDNVEAKIGRIKFLLLFLLCAIVGNVFQYLINPSSSIPMIGASGAVSGVLGAYLVFFPRSQIKTALLFLVFLNIVNIPAFIYIVYWFVLQLFAGIFSLSFSFQSGGVAFFAHIGGFVTGFYFAKRLNVKKPDYIEGEIVQ